MEKRKNVNDVKKRNKIDSNQQQGPEMCIAHQNLVTFLQESGE